MSSPLIFACVASLVLGIGLAAFLFRRRQVGNLLLKQEIDHLRQTLETNGNRVNNQLSQLNKEIGSRLDNNLNKVSDRLDNAARVVGDVQNKLGRLETATQQVHIIGKEIANLQESFRSPKFRGGFGEFSLGTILSETLPEDNFELQYGFKTGDRVDAVIKTREGLLPIDAKFPLPNFRKLVEAKDEESKKNARREFLSDIRRHIDDITKYIRPDEGTLTLAFMYIPAENIYYESIVKDEWVEGDLLDYAHKNRVIPVSPNSLYAYLQVIALGFRGMKIEEWARTLDSNLHRLKEDLLRFSEEFSQIGGHLKNTRQKYDSAEKRLEKFQEKLTTLEAPAETERLKVVPGAS